MSKVLVTLAWYHDGGTLRPQLVLSSAPTTSLVMKGSNWKGARISNANAGSGARNRLEYSLTGGMAVTRASLVINTSAILPPMVWLSKHPCGPPTKTGPRSKEETQKRRRLEWEKLQALEEAKKNPQEDEEPRRSSRNPRDQFWRQELLEDHPYDSKSNETSSRYQNRIDDHEYIEPRAERYPQILDKEARRLARRRRLEGSSSTSSLRDQYVAAAPRGSSSLREQYGSPRRERSERSWSPPQQYSPPPSYRDDRGEGRYAQMPDHEARRRERRRRLEGASGSSLHGSSPRYRRSHRKRRDGVGGDGADEDDHHGVEDGDAGGFGGDGGGGGGGE